MNEIKNLFIEGTSKTPHIDFNKNTGELILFGKSIPENAAKVYEPLLIWIKNYIVSPRPITNFRLNLEYFNTPSLLWFTKIIRMLSKIENDDHILFIHKYFDIEDFDSIEMEEIKDFVDSLVDNIGDVKISIGVKAYGSEDNGKIVKESLIFI